MKNCERASGFTVVEVVVLIFIACFVLCIAIPKFISATNLRRAKEVSVILNRLYEAEYSYHHKHGMFCADINALPVHHADLQSNWFRYDVEFAAQDTFYIRAAVKRAFGRADTSDWAAISSAKIRTISNPKTFGKYAVDWMSQIRHDDTKWYHRHFDHSISYDPD